MASILTLDRRGRQIPHITTSTRLRDGETDAFPSTQNLRHDLCLQRLRRVLPERWRADGQAHEDRRDGPAAVEFVPENEVVEAVPVFGLDATDDGVVLPFLWDGFAESDGDEEAVVCAFLID